MKNIVKSSLDNQPNILKVIPMGGNDVLFKNSAEASFQIDKGYEDCRT